ncbi:DUF1156 domain-containing protein [Candidatus Poriferisocius sp.]|uniref:DUF1156 domain-containing protein n=1 Tax=Candidatus Poriferisocius sp. TaxID=3101276 RepID=UPI003B5A5FAC
MADYGFRRKLIEVALPLDAINAASAREKSIRHGHPSTLHLWWARRPLAACRAVLFASLVDDPSARPDEFPTEEAQGAERERLFGLVERLVQWENSGDAGVLGEARAEIAKCCDGELPSVLDPFAGGGSIPLEAQRLGLEAHGSDLNPVAVLINKALVEIPPVFAGRAPVNPGDRQSAGLGSWPGASGLAADVRWYGQWMRDRAEERIGHLYPQVDLPPEHGGGEATVIAWLWTRTARCPNPGCGGEAPLASSWWLSKKKGRQVWVEPVVDHAAKAVRYEIGGGEGGPPEAPKQGRAQFRCVFCSSAMPGDYVKTQAQTGGLGARLMAVAAQGDRRRVYLPPDPYHEQAACIPPPPDPPAGRLPDEALGFRVQRYGMGEWADLFTPRQLTALCCFADLVAEAREQARADALAAGIGDDPTPLRDGGTGATAYAEAVSVYLAFAVDRAAMAGNSLCRWNPVGEKAQHFFGRQAVSMIWDYAEANPFFTSTGSLETAFSIVADVLQSLPSSAHIAGKVNQLDAAASVSGPVVVSTDPPYYDNIGYADLSDFFYVWLRRTVGGVFSDVCSTLLAPKGQELIAAPYRHGGDKNAAEEFFEDGLGGVFARLRDAQDPRFPLSVYYAFKQAETADGETASTGWETMLTGLLRAGFQITGTWPVRSELANRMRSQQSNALASSIVLVCRPRADGAPLASRREFLNALAVELPAALADLQKASIAPVDVAQAAIGPGMAVFSRYSRVIEADGARMGVRAALAAINRVLDETLEATEADLDSDTRWALTWHAQNGFEPGDYGQAEQLSKSRNTSVDGLVEAGIVESRAGRVRLIPRHELDENWSPASDERLTVWEIANHLAYRLETRGEQAAALLLRQVGGLADSARHLAYRLHHICDRNGWAADALAYNSLAAAWPDLTQQAQKPPTENQANLDLDT